MGTIPARAKKDGSISYTAVIRKKKAGKVVLTVTETFPNERTARRWMKQRERDLGAKGAVALSDRYVSRLLRLAWLSPDVLERLVVRREPCAISLYDLCFIASLPWDEQPARVFD